MNRRELLRIGSILLLLLLPLLATGQNLASTGWESLGPEGGNLWSLVRDPVSGALFTATYDYPTRVYKSTNDGDLWTPLGQIQDNIGFLLIDPQQPEYLYAASSYLGYGTSLGIYKSINGGWSWSRQTFAGETDYNYTISEFCIDNANPKNLSIVGYFYVFVGSNVTYRSYEYRSTDAGVTWSVKTFDNVAADQFVAYCKETDPSDSRIQYIGGYTIKTGNTYPKVFKTTNDGSSWIELAGLSGMGYVYDFLIDPTSPSKVYAVGSMGVYRSLDKGANWQLLTSSAWGAKLLFDPKSYSTIYVFGSGVNCFRSTDAGVTWTSISLGLSGGATNGLLVNPSATNTMYTVTHGGFFRSTDSGAHWTTANHGMLSTYIPSVKCSPSSPTVLYVSVLNSGLYKTTNALGKTSPAGSQSIVWQKMPEYSYCEGILRMELSPGDANILYIQEGAG